ncbi:site-specific DNA-methyltransferase [Campylobacter jejuni]|nr:site-specific DNA-methyltransferase [Campylobacter jejuni]
MKENIRLFNDDCLQIALQFKKENIIFDSIITDPPYNISKENNFHTLKSKRQGVDFGEWDKEFDTCEWIEYFAPLVTKNGSMIIFCSYLYLSFIIKKLGICGFITKDILRWEKTNPMPRNVNRRYVQDCEFAIWAVKNGAKWTFNKPIESKYLKPCFKTSLVSGEEKTSHPTQKSLKLMREIIQIHTNENDLICDPFMGSGTMGVASVDLGRKFIGIELDKEYFQIAKDRIQNLFIG